MATRTEHKLLDSLIDAVIIRNDADLARALKVKPPTISHLRSGSPLGDAMRVKIMRRFGLTLKKVDELSPPK